MIAPRVLLIIPPLTQLNTPYPSTAYLAGFLKPRGHAVSQADVGIEMVLALFCRNGLERVFDYVDYMTLDDGERPLLCLLEYLSGKRDEAELRRTFLCVKGKVVWRDGARDAEFEMADVGTPTYAGLPLDRYLSSWIR